MWCQGRLGFTLGVSRRSMRRRIGMALFLSGASASHRACGEPGAWQCGSTSRVIGHGLRCLRCSTCRTSARRPVQKATRSRRAVLRWSAVGRRLARSIICVCAVFRSLDRRRCISGLGVVCMAVARFAITRRCSSRCQDSCASCAARRCCPTSPARCGANPRRTALPCCAAA